MSDSSHDSAQSFHGRFAKSTFPPERIIPILFPEAGIRLVNIAPSGTAAEGSTIIFILSHMVRMACTIPSSVTVTILLT